MRGSRLWSIVTLLILVILVRFLFLGKHDKPNKRSVGNGRKNESRKPKFKGTPPQKIDLFMNYIKAHLPSVSLVEAKGIFPRKYEVHGHVVVVRMNNNITIEQFSPFAEAFAKSFLPIIIDVILVDTKGIEGELRIPTLVTVYSAPSASLSSFSEKNRSFILKKWKELRSKGIHSHVSEEELHLLLGNCFLSETMTLHVENGVRYSFDVRKVMFSSGNTTERMHFATVDASNEIVVDMFAGIGYFTIPIAMHGSPSEVHALEKNPDSVSFLKLNAIQNGVSHIVKPECGDNRLIGDKLQGRCDRVFMGYIPCCKSFLKRAVFFLKKSGNDIPVGIIHYHFLSDNVNARGVVYSHVREELGDFLASVVKLKDLRCIKSYAPKRFHFVADLSFL
ncbi:unnamed protein product [Phytomonas sp. EM1]|nr:unnamed protein product [Phytomonas sp. EM1]|eukprot:CCW64030.1 unnamed protein product [Phytomonas sp. isolate EM1]